MSETRSLAVAATVDRTVRRRP